MSDLLLDSVYLVKMILKYRIMYYEENHNVFVRDKIDTIFVIYVLLCLVIHAVYKYSITFY